MSREAGKELLENVLRRGRRAFDLLTRPNTVRIVGPAVLLVGVLLVAAALVGPFSGGGGGDDSSATGGFGLGPGSGGGVEQGGVPYPVPPEMVEAIRYLVPEKQPGAGFRVVIDSIGVNAQAVELGLDPRRVPQVPNEGAKVAWYNFSARPGTGGNAVLAGHVRWGGEPGSFAELDELEDGDAIRLKWNDGKESVYEVIANRSLGARDAETLQAMAPASTDIITLITCGGDFVADRDNPLGGDFTERVVVQARLVRSNVSASSSR